MKKYILHFVGCLCASLFLIFAFSFCAQAGSASDPTFEKYEAQTVIDYDLNDGTLKIKWKSNGATKYYVKAILLNEKPNNYDDSQSSRAVAFLKDGTQTSSSVSFTVSKLTQYDAKYLKVAVGAIASGESTSDASWNWVGFRLIKSIVKAGTPVFTNGKADTIIDYDIADGGLIVSWKCENADCYKVKAILMDAKPNFNSSNDTAVATLYDEYPWKKTSLPFSVNDLAKASYLKVAVGAMSQDETVNEAHWAVIAFRIVKNSSSNDPYPSSNYRLTGNAHNDLLGVAKTQIGYTGSATSSNITGANVISPGDYTKYGAYTGTNGQDWCASFVSWCANEAKVSSIKKTGLAGPGQLCTNAYKKGGVVYFNELNSTQSANHSYLTQYGIKSIRDAVVPAPGDLIFFRWSNATSSTTFSHVGIVSKVSGGKVYYIDGNGSGDVVKERSKSLTSTDIAAYCKLAGSFSVTETKQASAPIFKIGGANTIYDYNINNGALTVSWTAENATHFRVRAILMNETPRFDDAASSQAYIKELYGVGNPKGEEYLSTSLPFSSVDLLNASYLKVAVGAMSNDENVENAHWSVIAFRLSQPEVSGWQMPMNNAAISRGWNAHVEEYINSKDGRCDHVALDMTGSDSIVKAANSGRVVATGYNGANGNYVIIQHQLSGKTIYSFYAHLKSINVNNGQAINSGEKLGIVGSTGDAANGRTHLHFSIVDKAVSTGSYYGYVPHFSGNSVTYSNVTFYNPQYVINNNSLPGTGNIVTDSPDITITPTPTILPTQEIPSTPPVSNAKDGFVNKDGNLYYYTNGEVDANKNGLVLDSTGNAWYYCALGCVQSHFSGLAEYGGEWFYLENGKLNTARAGLVTYNGGRFMIASGRILREYSGLIMEPNTNKWYYVAAGQVVNYTGLALYDGAWFYVINGELGVNFTGEVEYDGAKFNVVNGMLVV